MNHESSLKTILGYEQVLDTYDPHVITIPITSQLQYYHFKNLNVEYNTDKPFLYRASNSGGS